MRYGIFSDIHSNLEALQAVVHAYQEEKIDYYFCAGDIVGYASNSRECIGLMRELPGASVMGNHDLAAVGLMPLDVFNAEARFALLWTQAHLQEEEKVFLKSLAFVFSNSDITIVHGSLSEPKDFNYMFDAQEARASFKLLKTQVCFVGHTHYAGVFSCGTSGSVEYQRNFSIDIQPGYKYIVDAGSVGQPRDGNPSAVYCVYDIDKKKIEVKRVAYEVRATHRKIINAGLPKFLADRLLVGK